MNKLNKLNLETQNSLISGVSIPSISSILIELIQNSIDSNCTSIEIKLNISNWSFEIKDNGIGINENDLKCNFGKFYHTNKQNSFCYGHKGMAIAAICEISHLIVVTSTNCSKYSYVWKSIDYNVIQTNRKISNGTTVIVKDIFYNLPVRRKSTKFFSEMNQIKDFIQSISLLYYDIAWHVIDVSTKGFKIVYHSNIKKSVFDRFSEICESVILDHIKTINIKKENISIQGLLSPLVSSACHYNKEYQYLYVNNYSIRNKSDFVHTYMNSKFMKFLNDSVLSKYAKHSTNKTNNYACFVLQLILPFEYFEILSDTNSANVMVKYNDEQKIASLLDEVIKSVDIQGRIPKVNNFDSVTSTKNDNYRNNADDFDNVFLVSPTRHNEILGDNDKMVNMSGNYNHEYANKCYNDIMYYIYDGSCINEPEAHVSISRNNLHMSDYYDDIDCYLASSYIDNNISKDDVNIPAENSIKRKLSEEYPNVYNNNRSREDIFENTINPKKSKSGCDLLDVNLSTYLDNNNNSKNNYKSIKKDYNLSKTSKYFENNFASKNSFSGYNNYDIQHNENNSTGIDNKIFTDNVLTNQSKDLQDNENDSTGIANKKFSDIILTNQSKDIKKSKYFTNNVNFDDRFNHEIVGSEESLNYVSQQYDYTCSNNINDDISVEGNSNLSKLYSASDQYNYSSQLNNFFDFDESSGTVDIKPGFYNHEFNNFESNIDNLNCQFDKIPNNSRNYENTVNNNFEKSSSHHKDTDNEYDVKSLQFFDFLEDGFINTSQMNNNNVDQKFKSNDSAAIKDSTYPIKTKNYYSNVTPTSHQTSSARKSKYFDSQNFNMDIIEKPRESNSKYIGQPSSKSNEFELVTPSNNTSNNKVYSEENDAIVSQLNSKHDTNASSNNKTIIDNDNNDLSLSFSSPCYPKDEFLCSPKSNLDVNITRDMIKNSRVIGQTDNKFILLYTFNNCILAVDQHAADERIIYEKLQNNLQVILKSVRYEIKLSNLEKWIISIKDDYIKSFGFNYHYKANSDNNILVLIQTISINHEILTYKDFQEFLYYISINIDIPDKLKIIKPPAINRILTSNACRKAIKFNQAIDISKCVDIINKLSEVNLPFICAHGRPSVIPLLKCDDFNIN